MSFCTVPGCDCTLVNGSIDYLPALICSILNLWPRLKQVVPPTCLLIQNNSSLPATHALLWTANWFGLDDQLLPSDLNRLFNASVNESVEGQLALFLTFGTCDAKRMTSFHVVRVSHEVKSWRDVQHIIWQVYHRLRLNLPAYQHYEVSLVLVVSWKSLGQVHKLCQIQSDINFLNYY